MKTLLAAAAIVPLALAAAAPAQAAPIFTSTFESVPGGPTSDGAFTSVSEADGWTATSGVIELQRRAAGSPAIDGGNVFVELDSTANSAMSRTIAAAGSYTLSFLYSPRPGIPASSNGIDILLGGTLLDPPGTLTGAGGADTLWSSYSVSFFANAGDTLTFSAAGTSDSLGGYLDNISLSAVPEPGTWAMMIFGFGAVGGAMRSRRKATHAIA